MPFFDALTGLIIATSLLFGVITGFMGTILSFITWCTSIYCSYKFSDLLAPLMSRYITHTPTAQFITSTLLFFCCIIFLNIISNIILSSTSRLRSFGIDSVLGGALGLARGYIIALFIYTLIVFGVNITVQDRGLFNDSKNNMPNWLSNSYSYPYLQQGLKITLGKLTNSGNTDSGNQSESDTKIGKKSINDLINKFYEESKRQKNNEGILTNDKIGNYFDIDKLNSMSYNDKQELLNKLVADYADNSQIGNLDRGYITQEDLDVARKLIEQQK